MEVRPVKPWIFWAILYVALWAALSSSVICAILAYQMIVVKGQNQWSIEDRAELHSRQEQTLRTLKQLDDRSDYLDATVRGLIKAEQARQERRKAEEARRKQP